MGVDAMEAAIVERLTAALPKVAVDTFPDDFDEYPKLPLNRGALVLVAYRGGRFAEPRSLGAIVQEHRAEFEVQLVTKSLRGHQGATRLLDQVRQVLTGFRPADADPMFPVSEQFVTGGGGRWIYAQLYATSIPHVELGADDEEAPFVQATNIDTTTDTTWQYDLATDAFTEEAP